MAPSKRRAILPADFLVEDRPDSVNRTREPTLVFVPLDEGEGMTTDATGAADVGRGFLEALEGDDHNAVRAYCADDARFWNNLDVERSVDEMLAVHAAEQRLVPDLHFEDDRFTETDSGYVHQATIRGTTTKGDDVEIPLCAVVTVVDGRISRVEEYVSSSHVRPIIEAMRHDAD